MNVENAIKASIHNRDEITPNTPCGCCFCLRVFKGDEIIVWIDDETTALCPHCDMDTMLPNETDIEFLTAAHERWFTMNRSLNI